MWEWFVIFIIFLTYNNSINWIIFCCVFLERLTNDEIADYLDIYMDDEFNTELEDDSSKQVAAELLRFYRYCMEGDELTAKTEFEKLPPLQSWLNLEQPVRPTRPVRRESSSSDENMDVDKNKQENDEWTVVTNRRSK